MQRRSIETNFTEEDRRIEGTLRPQRLRDYVGQTRMKESLDISITAARQRKEPLDHLLFYGPPGLGKTTISGIIANEMGVNIKITSGPAIEKPGEMAAILNGLKENDILFVDEIHRLNKQVEEVLYPAMEDFAIDILIGKGAGGQVDPARAPALYTDRRHDQGGAFVCAFARPLRGDPQAGILLDP